MTREINVGQRWAHYKHPTHQYEIIGIARDSSSSETLEDMIVYKALYAGKFPFGQLWVRPKKEFLSTVVVDGKEVERFRLC